MVIRYLIKYKNSFSVIFINKIQLLTEKWNSRILNWATKSPRRASYYYALFSSRFDREHFSVLYGMNLNIKGDIKSIALESNLRRYIHMIEKGLTALSPKPIFAEGYIEDTISILNKIVTSRLNENTKKWVYDVLSQYFETVVQTDKIKKANNLFLSILEKERTMSCDKGYYSPYKIKDIEKSKINYEEFLKLCNYRHSIRWYEDKEVPIDLVKNAIAAALTAPSACNRQPFRFIIVKEKEKLSKTVRLPMGADTFAHNIKLIIIIIGDLSAYFDERDRHLIYIDASLAAMNLMIALTTLGLSSCPINWPDIEEREQKIVEEFNLQPNEKGVMFISVGYPLEVGGIPFSSKKNIEEVISIY